MRSMRRVGVAVVAAVLGLGLSGCGGGEEPSATTSASEGSIDDLNKDLGYGDDADDDPFADDEPADEPSDEYPDTDESIAFDEKAASNGWEVDGYTQPSEYVLMMCESMDAWEPGAGENLARNQVPNMGKAEKTALREGAPTLCKKHAKEIKDALGGKSATRTMSEGTYKIVAGAGLSKEEVAPPGTYTVSGDLADCYWERTRKDGTIIDNQFATAARSITVTVRAGELFTSRDCGTWASPQ
ncbi:hypothetical protein ACFVY0_46705 [Streptomyces sp. NPDC058286]|uniref:hypothetical protein n=1 Tax=Streptomyces sp. NPDC058286 TaxID=3346422 RepID=UPI0036E2D6B0